MFPQGTEKTDKSQFIFGGMRWSFITIVFIQIIALVIFWCLQLVNKMAQTVV